METIKIPNNFSICCVLVLEIGKENKRLGEIETPVYRNYDMTRYMTYLKLPSGKYIIANGNNFDNLQDDMKRKLGENSRELEAIDFKTYDKRSGWLNF